MRWKNMSDKCQVLKWQRVTGHGVNSNLVIIIKRRETISDLPHSFCSHSQLVFI